MITSVREMKEQDINSVVDYFSNASPEYLIGMGADPAKLPPKKGWIKGLKEELVKPIVKKEIYYIIWEIDGQAVGHSNINKIKFGHVANIHLHMWCKENRQRKLGLSFVKKSIPYFFTNFELQQLICEPYALNPAPAKVLTALGFEFKKEYEMIPGTICFSQKVRRFELARRKWMKW